MLTVRLGNPRRGFTLVELMVVVAVIVILAALLVPRYVEVTTTARKAKCNANIATLNSALAMYFAKYGTPSTSLNLLAPEFISMVPTCPFGVGYEFDGYSITNLSAHEH